MSLFAFLRNSHLYFQDIGVGGAIEENFISTFVQLGVEENAGDGAGEEY